MDVLNAMLHMTNNMNEEEEVLHKKGRCKVQVMVARIGRVV
jgi:hypothetical protein